jgi:hypothetical protein
VAYATAVEASVPSSYTLREFIAGADQTKRIGVYRVWVACDNAVAVAAGSRSAGPGALYLQGDREPGRADPVPANPSEWIDLSFDDASKRVVASRRNYFGLVDTFLAR